MDEIIKAFDNQNIHNTAGQTTYLVTTITDHVPTTSPILLRKVIELMFQKLNIDCRKVNKIVGEEERGGYLAACFSLRANLPFCLAKQNPCHIVGEIGMSFEMAYKKDMSIYFNGLQRGDRVIIIDDIIDSGGTIIAIIKTLENIGVEIVKVLALAERTEKHGVHRIKSATGHQVETLIKLDTSGNKSKVLNKNELLSYKVNEKYNSDFY